MVAKEAFEFPHLGKINVQFVPPIDLRPLMDESVCLCLGLSGVSASNHLQRSAGLGAPAKKQLETSLHYVLIFEIG